MIFIYLLNIIHLILDITYSIPMILHLMNFTSVKIINTYLRYNMLQARFLQFIELYKTNNKTKYIFFLEITQINFILINSQTISINITIVSFKRIKNNENISYFESHYNVYHFIKEWQKKKIQLKWFVIVLRKLLIYNNYKIIIIYT